MPGIPLAQPAPLTDNVVRVIRMRDTSTRVFTLMCALVIVWVGVYWFYEPGEPPVTFDPRADVKSGDVAIRPDPLAQLSPGSQSAGDPAPKQPQPPAITRPPAKPPTPASSPQTTRVIPPKFHEYIVQPGDASLQVIAKKLLGDARHWHAIASANKYVDPRKLIPGRTRLLIPDDPMNVEGLVVSVDTQPRPATNLAPGAVPAGTSPEFTDYIIQRQDTLSEIAQAHYGKSSLWRQIYDANREAIPDPDHLKVGTTIRIPKNPS
ncbi:MAG: LysM peptidoglycan-binding domain-containing protein [Pyrinomonadaceae bacterium]|nr:LysM peptidoglycan-binding domain-containing protein [Phycisphaerales bacterium]